MSFTVTQNHNISVELLLSLFSFASCLAAAKTECVGVSLRPGAPPTMVSVPSVLDKLSASSLVTSDPHLTSAQSPSSSANHQSDDDVNEENLDICTGKLCCYGFVETHPLEGISLPNPSV